MTLVDSNGVIVALHLLADVLSCSAVGPSISSLFNNARRGIQCRYMSYVLI